ncbi:hypothetical protein [Agromyces sp. SYSU T0242]|uniref:hypothetical protein n=1 Tax=Agromyces litoreus TaxID=3158561 RepID=UPI00339A3B5B
MTSQHDERIARLQRLAYGAGGDDQGRRAALAELASLRGDDAESDAGATADPERGAESDEAPRSDDEPAAAPIANAAPRRGRAAVLTAAGAGLVAGIVLGWVAGGVSSDVRPDVRADETTAWEVFDRPASSTDDVGHPPLPEAPALDESSRRLLATRPDGVWVVGVRTADGADACLLLVLAFGAAEVSCTSGGRFPADGLVTSRTIPAVGDFSARWSVDGDVTLNAPARPLG